MRQVACPVLRRGTDVLVFRHPLAGHQLVKGGIAAGETPAQAATRELREEAGIESGARAVFAVETIGGQRWHFVDMHTDTSPPETWVHHCTDDGGHNFAFFWHPVAQSMPAPVHPDFDRALIVIRTVA